MHHPSMTSPHCAPEQRGGRAADPLLMRARSSRPGPHLPAALALHPPPAPCGRRVSRSHSQPVTANVVTGGERDGPATTAESVVLGRVLADAGVSTVAATPHLREDHPGVAPAELAERCGALAAEFAQAGVGLKVVPAGEVDLLWTLETSPEQLRLASYGQRGTDLLLETPYGPLPPHFEEHLLESPALAGYRILLAHPERSRDRDRHGADRRRLRRLPDRQSGARYGM